MHCCNVPWIFRLDALLQCSMDIIEKDLKVSPVIVDSYIREKRTYAYLGFLILQVLASEFSVQE